MAEPDRAPAQAAESAARATPLGPPATMSANICPACRVRYLPLRGACVCGGWRVTPGER